MIPEKDPLFIPFGHYETCEKIMESSMFFPTFLSGPSGVGKTVMVEQLCANLGKEYFRVNIIYETNETDLMGGLRLVDGSTVYMKGPVIEAMERGAVLLLDEVDLASPMLITCLQSVLEGKGYLLKKTNEWITPAPGFQVFATANTKGQGDDTGMFVGTQILNEAFLERFPVVLECTYPPEDIERNILTLAAKQYKVKKPAFINGLLGFAAEVRTMFLNGGIDVTISTRRLVFIIRTFAIFGDTQKAVELCFARFSEPVKAALLDILDLKYKHETPIENSSDPDSVSNLLVQSVAQHWKPF